MKKSYLSLFILAIGAAMFTACSDDDNNGENGNPNIPLAELSKPKANPWLAQEEYSITHFNSASDRCFHCKSKGRHVLCRPDEMQGNKQRSCEPHDARIHFPKVHVGNEQRQSVYHRRIQRQL